jgi:hypothetical protein
MTAAECRDRIVRHVAAVGGWVPIAELAEWMRTELKLTRTQGSLDLRDLVLTGRLERSADSPPTSWIRNYRYRVPPTGRHSGRCGVQRELGRGGA